MNMLVYFAVDDMQISEGLQLVVGHMIIRCLYRGWDGAQSFGVG